MYSKENSRADKQQYTENREIIFTLMMHILLELQTCWKINKNKITKQNTEWGGNLLAVNLVESR